MEHPPVTPRPAVRIAGYLVLVAALVALVPATGRADRDRDRHGHERARERLEALLRDPPDSASPFYRAGNRLYRAGDWSAAARAYREAAKRSTAPGNAYYNLACTLALGGSRGEALDALQAAIENGYDDVEHMEEDEDLESLHGDARFEALVRDAEGLEMPPVNPGAWGPFWRLGGAERESRDAVRRLDAWLSAHPRSGRAAYGLGIAHLNLSDYEASARAFSRAYELGYRPAATLYNLACVEARRGRLDEAFAWLDSAMEAGFDAAGQMRGDRDLDALRDDPRYRTLLRKAERHGRGHDHGGWTWGWGEDWSEDWSDD